MKPIFISTIFIALYWGVPAEAYRNCNSECPISFAPSDPSNPLQNYQERQNCLSRCQQDNDQLSEMEEQTRLLREQQEAQEELQDELEEQRSLIESMDP